MVSIYDVDSSELINALAEELKKVDAVKPPVWAAFVKTGISKERPPVNRGWWYVRAASVLRHVSARGPIGVAKLRVMYGSKKNRGVAAEHFYKASGNNIRKILQQLEKAELIKKDKAGVHKGRVITPKGLKLLNNTAKVLAKTKPVEKKETVVEEIKKAPEKTEDKVAEMVKKTKQHAAGKEPTAQEIIEEVSKQASKEKKASEPKKSQKVSGGLEAKPKSEALKTEARPEEKKRELKEKPKETPKVEQKPKQEAKNG